MILSWNPRLPFNDVLDRINDGFFSTLRRRSHFGAARAGAFPDDLPKAYLNAVQALCGRNLLTGKSRIHRERAVESEGSRTLRLSSYEEKFKLAHLAGARAH